MLRPYMGSSYAGALEVLPRLLLGGILINTAAWWCRLAIDANNAACGVFGAPDLGRRAFGVARGRGRPIVGLLMVLIFIVMAILLAIQQLMRLALVDVLFILAPLAALLWILPQSQAWGRLWGRLFVGTVFAQAIQVLTLHLGFNLATGLPPLNAAGLLQPLLGIAVLALALKIPSLMGGGAAGGNVVLEPGRDPQRRLALALGSVSGQLSAQGAASYRGAPVMGSTAAVGESRSRCRTLLRPNHEWIGQLRRPVGRRSWSLGGGHLRCRSGPAAGTDRACLGWLWRDSGAWPAGQGAPFGEPARWSGPDHGRDAHDQSAAPAAGVGPIQSVVACSARTAGRLGRPRPAQPVRTTNYRSDQSWATGATPTARQLRWTGCSARTASRSAASTTRSRLWGQAPGFRPPGPARRSRAGAGTRARGSWSAPACSRGNA